MIDQYLTIGGLFVTIFASVWSLAWWLSGKFEAIQKYLQERIKEVETTILNKLEYHERHDDVRFNSIHNDVWELRIHNAARDGKILKKNDAKEAI